MDKEKVVERLREEFHVMESRSTENWLLHVERNGAQCTVTDAGVYRSQGWPRTASGNLTRMVRQALQRPPAILVEPF